MGRNVSIELDDRDRALLEGAEGEAMRLAMQVVLRAAEISGAMRLQDICFAHIDACFYNGQAHVDFARFSMESSANVYPPVVLPPPPSPPNPPLPFIAPLLPPAPPNPWDAKKASAASYSSLLSPNSSSCSRSSCDSINRYYWSWSSQN